MSVDFGALRSALHARDMRALIEASYRKRRYVLYELHERYISDNMPEHEHEVYRWACAMVDHLLERSSVPHVMIRAFAATWAESVLGGHQMPVRLSGSRGGYVYTGHPTIGWLQRLAGRCPDHKYNHGLDIPYDLSFKKAKGWEVLWV